MIFIGMTICPQANTPILINANGRWVGEIVNDIILDGVDYNRKNIRITSATFNNFSVYKMTQYPYPYIPAEYYRNVDQETYRLIEHNLFNRWSNSRWCFYFQPADREGRRIMMELDGMAYNSPRRVTINGIYYRLRDVYANTIHNIFVVTSFTLNEIEYIGINPRWIQSAFW